MPDVTANIFSKHQRIALFHQRLALAPAAASIPEAWKTMNDLLADIEVAHADTEEQKMTIPVLGRRETFQFGDDGVRIVLIDRYIDINANGAIRLLCLKSKTNTAIKPSATGEAFVEAAASDRHYLVPITHTWPDAVLEKVRMLVAAKRELDRVMRTPAYRVIAESFEKHGLESPIGAMDFRAEILPFADVSEPIGKDYWTAVPVDQTIGANWRRHPEDLSPAERAKWAAQLYDKQGVEEASFVLIEPLGLFLAVNGQNRVALLEAEGYSHCCCWLSHWSYPTSNRLRIYIAESSLGTEWWAVLDNVLIERLSHPSWVIPILTAYGVPTAEPWPDHFPGHEAVLKRFNTPMWSGKYDRRGNLESVRLELEKAEEVIKTHLWPLAANWSFGAKAYPQCLVGSGNWRFPAG